MVVWICPECNEEVEDSFDICWNCSAVRAIDGKESESAGKDGPGHPALDREGGAKQQVLPVDASPPKAEEIPLKVFLHSLAQAATFTGRLLYLDASCLGCVDCVLGFPQHDRSSGELAAGTGGFLASERGFEWKFGGCLQGRAWHVIGVLDFGDRCDRFVCAR